VYSKISLQIDAIRAATPRAVYFDDDTYVAWVQGTHFLEVTTMDSVLGPVFYTLPNQDAATTGATNALQGDYRAPSSHTAWSVPARPTCGARDPWALTCRR
jgi:hypothetical protein